MSRERAIVERFVSGAITFDKWPAGDEIESALRAALRERDEEIERMREEICDLAVKAEGHQFRVVIREGWADAGRAGLLLAQVYVPEQWWGVVAWDNEEDPECHKMAGLEAAT